jgi:hypothetical protein
MAQAQAGHQFPVAQILLSEFHLQKSAHTAGWPTNGRSTKGDVIQIVPGDKATYPAAGQSLTPTSCNFHRTVVTHAKKAKWVAADAAKHAGRGQQESQGIPRMRSVISAVSLPLIGCPVLSFPRMKDVCPQIVRGKLALGSTLCRFIGQERRVRDGFTISYKRSLSQHCKSIPHN